MLVVPKEEGEGKERKVVVCSLEAGEASEDYHDNEELLDVLNHAVIRFITYMSISLF